ncbi:MAG: hypothetical protein ABW166_19220 [Sedimenticola sp.]
MGFFRTTATALVFTLSFSAHASSARVSGEGVLLGFDDVTIGVTTYNVTFKGGTKEDAYGGTAYPYLDWYKESDAADAADALLAAFDASSWDNRPADARATSISSQYAWQLLTPFGDLSLANTKVTAVREDKTGPDYWDWSYHLSTFEQNLDNTTNSAWVDWDVVNTGGVIPTPIPAAAWLFGSALLGLIGFTKRKKAA